MTTYTNIQNDVIEWTARTDLTTNVLDTCIRLAEGDIARNIRAAIQQVNVDLVIPDTGALDLPAGYLGARSVTLVQPNDFNDCASLDYVTPDIFYELRFNKSLVNGLYSSTVYTIEANQIKITPKPSTGETVSVNITYYKRFDPLNNINTSNWLLENHYSIYLYLVLKHVWVYLQDEMQSEYFNKLFINSLEDFRLSENKKERSSPKKRRKLGVTP